MTIPLMAAIVVGVVCLAVGAAIGYLYYNSRYKDAQKTIGNADAEATRIVNEAIKTAEQKRKEAVIEAKDEAFRLRAEADKEI